MFNYIIKTIETEDPQKELLKTNHIKNKNF